jgi:hypothetical protein
MNRGSAAEKAFDEDLERIYTPVMQGPEEVGVKYLVSICSSMARLSPLVSRLRNIADSNPSIDPLFVHDLDVLAFGIAVDSALFFELGFRDDPASSTVKAWAGVTMTAAVRLRSALDQAAAFTTGGSMMASDDLTDSTRSALQVLARLSDGLRFLCTWWIVAEALMLVVEARTSAARVQTEE